MEVGNRYHSWSISKGKRKGGAGGEKGLHKVHGRHKFSHSTPSSTVRAGGSTTNETPSHWELLCILNECLLQEKSSFHQIFLTILFQVTGISAFAQIAGFYPQSSKAKRSLANFNYVKSSGDAGSFAASRTWRGHPSDREVPPRSPGPGPVKQRLGVDTKEAFR